MVSCASQFKEKGKDKLRITATRLAEESGCVEGADGRTMLHHAVSHPLPDGWEFCNPCGVRNGACVMPGKVDHHRAMFGKETA